MFYDVLYYSYQFETKSDDIWDSKRVEDEFLKQVDYDADCSETFDNREEAMQSVEEYMANRMLAPRIVKTKDGHAICGEVLEVVERTEDFSYGAGCIYTKGMEDKGAE